MSKVRSLGRQKSEVSRDVFREVVDVLSRSTAAERAASIERTRGKIKEVGEAVASLCDAERDLRTLAENMDDRSKALCALFHNMFLFRSETLGDFEWVDEVAYAGTNPDALDDLCEQPQDDPTMVLVCRVHRAMKTIVEHQQ